MGSAIAVKSRGVSTDLPTWIRIAVLVALVSILYADVMLDLASEWWTRPEASYGMLIPPFALYVAYLKRVQMFSLPAQPDLRGLGLVTTACLTLLTGRLASEFFLSRI